jgi:peptidoglycan/xylan/chitin deacetylase (PgdA/CDA1 family)
MTSLSLIMYIEKKSIINILMPYSFSVYIAKKHVFRAVRYTGLPYLFRELIQRNRVTILLFHDIDKESAVTAFNYLSSRYNIIDLNVFIEACEHRDFSKIPKKALIITFDDGHISNYDLLEHIEQISMPVTIFLCAGIVGTNRQFWFRSNADEQVKREVKYMSNQARLVALRKYGFDQYAKSDTVQALTKEHIDEMKAKVNLQSHTMFHPCLPRCDYEEAKWEITESKRILEQEYGLNINSISYPNGDYSERDIEIVKKAGYKCAITVDYGFNNIDSNLFALKRLSVNDTGEINELIVKSSGVWAFVKKYTRSGEPYGYTKHPKGPT